jgi:hypothetical protein
MLATDKHARLAAMIAFSEILRREGRVSLIGIDPPIISNF